MMKSWLRYEPLVRKVFLLSSGVVLLQMGGCDATGFFDLVQTVLLGVSAAGAIAIIQNI